MIRIDEYLDLLRVSENLNRYVGLMVEYDVAIPTYSDVPIYVTNPVHTDVEFMSYATTGELPFIPASGKGFEIRNALLSLYGEFLERGLPIAIGRGADVFAKASQLSKENEIIGPGKLHLFAEEQYKEGIPFRRFTADLKLGWVKARRAFENGEVLIPAQAAVFGYRRLFNEPLIAYGSTAGLSYATSRHTAIYKGFIEFVERDSVNIGWHSDIPPYRINIGLEDILDILGLDAALPKSLIAHTYLWRTDVDGIYVVSVHVIDKRRKILSYYPGCGAGVSFTEALARAFGEVGQAYLYVYSIYKWRKALGGRDADIYYIDRESPPQEADNLFKTIFYYGYPENLERLYREFFSRSPELSKDKLELDGGSTRTSRRLSIVKSIIKEKGLNPLVINHTPPSAEGYVLKVFIPELTPYNSARYPFLGHPRYYIARKILKVGEDTLTYSDLRKYSVPYP